MTEGWNSRPRGSYCGKFSLVGLINSHAVFADILKTLQKHASDQNSVTAKFIYSQTNPNCISTVLLLPLKLLSP